MSDSQSKYWSDMYISNDTKDTNETNQTDDTNETNTKDFIISTDPPVNYDSNVNVIVHHGIKLSEYEEVSDFIRKYNKMSSGNTTLLPVEELERYLSIPNISVLLRSSKGLLIGTIICLLLPIKNKSQGLEKVITHGCTTFLTVHPSVRGMGLCMALIRGLINYGYEMGVYCDYHMVSFQIGDNSFPLNSWFRPINLSRAKELGFLYPGYDDPRSVRTNRLKYRTKLPPDYSYVQITEENKNLKASLDYYCSLVDKDKDKMFSFYPDSEIWSKWVQAFPSYQIYNKKKLVGVVSLNTVFCTIDATNETGRALFPIVCIGDMKTVMPTLCNIAATTNHDIIYFHEQGDVTEEALSRTNTIMTTTKPWFSLYNNNIRINPSNLYVPLL